MADSPDTIVVPESAPISAAEFVTECDRLGYIYYAYPSAQPGSIAVTTVFPEHGSTDGERQRWFELMRLFDSRSKEFGRYLLRVGRTSAWYMDQLEKKAVANG
jgi:hypothetical protein